MQLWPERHRSPSPTRPQLVSRVHAIVAKLWTTASSGVLGPASVPGAGSPGASPEGGGLSFGPIGMGSPLPGVPVSRWEPASVARMPLIAVRASSFAVRPALSTNPAASTVRDGGGALPGVGT